jgi:hypothetical protein
MPEYLSLGVYGEEMRLAQNRSKGFQQDRPGFSNRRRGNPDDPCSLLGSSRSDRSTGVALPICSSPVPSKVFSRMAVNGAMWEEWRHRMQWLQAPLWTR